jgi:hypothetical protein
MMKRIIISLVNEELIESPGDDIPAFTIYLEETPAIGDSLFICSCDPVADDDETDMLHEYCQEVFPKEKTTGFGFKVVDKTFMRMDDFSEISLDIRYIPGIHQL